MYQHINIFVFGVHFLFIITNNNTNNNNNGNNDITK